MREYSKFDEIIATLQRTYSSTMPLDTEKLDEHTDEELASNERLLAANLMRVNHSGEVAAQALYLGQYLAANREDTRSHMKRCADEEIAHLHWCEERLQELESKPSVLAPVWFIGCLTIGFIVGKFGDEVSYSFTAETEHQVAKHLNDHLERLPEKDIRSRAILSTMLEDETAHMQDAFNKTNFSLPKRVKSLMTLGGEALRKISLKI